MVEEHIPPPRCRKGNVLLYNIGREYADFTGRPAGAVNDIKCGDNFSIAVCNIVEFNEFVHNRLNLCKRILTEYTHCAGIRFSV